MYHYSEGETPTIINTGGGYGNNDGWGNSAWWIIIALALFGGGFGGYGGFGGRGGLGNAGSEVLGYELGKVATTNDIASGFNNSAVLSSLNDQKLAVANGFANVQSTLCQGFNGVNTAILQSNNAMERGVAQTNFNLANGLNGISQQIGNCCCDVKSILLENRYLNEKQTCDIITNQTAVGQRVIDYLVNKENQNLRDENFALRLSASQEKQNNYLVDRITPCAKPAYLVCNPNTGLTYPAGYGNFGFNCCGNGIV